MEGLDDYTIVFSNQKKSARKLLKEDVIDQQTVEEAYNSYKSIYKSIIDSSPLNLSNRTVYGNLDYLVSMYVPQSIILDAINYGLVINFTDIYQTLFYSQEQIKDYREDYIYSDDNTIYSDNLYQEDYLNEIIYAAFVQSVENKTFDLNNKPRTMEEFTLWGANPDLSTFDLLDDMLSQLNMEPVRQRIHEYLRNHPGIKFKRIEHI